MTLCICIECPNEDTTCPPNCLIGWSVRALSQWAHPEENDDDHP